MVVLFAVLVLLVVFIAGVGRRVSLKGERERERDVSPKLRNAAKMTRPYHGRKDPGGGLGRPMQILWDRVIHLTHHHHQPDFTGLTSTAFLYQEKTLL
jgi:hypothetical protein